MSSLAIGGIVFACVFGGSLMGMLLRAFLAEHHLTSESKDVVRMGAGLIGSMAALLLGLLVASAKGAFDVRRNEMQQMSANMVLFDRVLAHYGPEAGEARRILREAAAASIERLSSETAANPTRGLAKPTFESLFETVQNLTPKNDSQRAMQAQALKIGMDFAQTRWLLAAQMASNVSVPLLAVMVFWLSIVFTSFSLFVKPNIVVVGTLILCAASVSGAIFLILEMDRPFDGMIQISREPFRAAISQLGR